MNTITVVALSLAVGIALAAGVVRSALSAVDAVGKQLEREATHMKAVDDAVMLKGGANDNR